MLTSLFDLTNKCNIRCRMCHFAFDSLFHRAPVFMGVEDFERIATQILPRSHTVYLSAGSEPLLHPEFERVLAVADGHGPLRKKLLTNGLLLSPRLDEAMIEFGLDELHVSVDGATRETYEGIRRGGSFDRLVANLERLRDRKASLGSPWPRLQFNVTLMRSNLRELERFVDLAERLGVERIAARHLMPYDGLDVGDETTHQQPRESNEAFVRFLERAHAAGVQVTSFPDFYEVDGAPWVPPVDRSTEPDPASPAILGRVDLPGPPAGGGAVRVRGVASLAGWALARTGVSRVAAEVDEDGRWRPLGEATLHNGTRPDVGLVHPEYPQVWRAGWTLELPADRLGTGGRRVRLVAHDRAGSREVLGERILEATDDADVTPFRFCAKPFETVYVTSGGEVYPYPDCQTVDPVGSLLGDGTFEELWRSAALEELRTGIEERRPPTMCLTCPDFINRNPDDPAYFALREVESAHRRPTGHLDAFGPRMTPGGPVVTFSGWAVGFSPVRSVELLRDARPGDPEDRARPGGLTLIASADPGAIRRPDVARRYARYVEPERSGFRVEVPLVALLEGAARVHLRVVATTEEGISAIIGAATVQGSAAAVGMRS